MKKSLSSFLYGAICAFAFAPFNFFFAAIISLCGFYFLLEKAKTKKSAFWCGFFYVFGYFFTGIYWVSVPMILDSEQPAIFAPLSVVFLPIAFGIYLPFVALFYKFLTQKFNFKNYQKVLIFSLLWLLWEVLRSNCVVGTFSGFPWNLLGYIWLFNINFAQFASIFSIYGLSFFAVLVCLLPSFFYKKNAIRKFSDLQKSDRIFVTVIFVLLIFSFIFGKIYIDDAKLKTDEKTSIRLVQSGFKSGDRNFSNEHRSQEFWHLAELTKSEKNDNIKIVIWPEIAARYFISDQTPIRKILSKLAGSSRVIITGSYRGNPAEGAWNSLFVIDNKGIVDHYDKRHLAPFGEYVPIRSLLGKVYKPVGLKKEFYWGEPKEILNAKFVKVAPMICYEAIFFDLVDRKNLPDLLVAITNDSWFVNSTQPYQHFNMARMRAIEYGIPMARTAQNGISAFVDPFGRVVKKLDMEEVGIIDHGLIKMEQKTIYARYGYLPLILLILGTLTFLISPKRKPYVSRQDHAH